MKNKIYRHLLVVVLSFGLVKGAFACTNFLVTKGASADNSTMITYAADSHTLYGELYFWDAADHPVGSMLQIKEWDTGKPLGQIAQVAHTYKVIGNMNEYQLAIGETTFGGRKELGKQDGAIMDYGSLIYVTLQRAKTAREAIKVMTDLVAEYGYHSSGESFSISDGDEVWILEMIGKGNFEKGAVWVAKRVPDGYISGHANQARITDIVMNDPDNCLYSKDVISFARDRKWFGGKDKDFSFSDIYNPLDFGGARFCDARVWAGFNYAAPGSMDKYESYVMGNIDTVKYGIATNRMPLWIKPSRKLSVQDLMYMMRDHYEGTVLDMTKDAGAGPFELPYRWRSLTWKYDSVEYCNERAVATQQTGFSFVAQSRSNVPDPIGGVFWFGVDDAASSCYTPIYTCLREVPECFRVGNGDMLTYSESSAFWTFSQVANIAYTRYNVIIKEVQEVQSKLENDAVAVVKAMDVAAKQLWDSGNKTAAEELLSDYSVSHAQKVFDRWKDLSHYLQVKYKDGNIMKTNDDGSFKRTEYGLPPSPDFPGYPDSWKKIVVESAGDKLKVIE
ncbi:MAG: dipeptidase [Bacteroidales bacterium]